MMTLGQRVILAAIRRYQGKGGGVERFRVDCNFEPSCSEYARQAVLRYGAAHGTVMALRRVGRCTDRDCVNRIADPLPKE